MESLRKEALSSEGLESEAQRGIGQAGPSCQLENGELKAGTGVQSGAGALGERGAGI